MNTAARSNLEEFAATLQTAAQDNGDILVVTSDSRGSGKLGTYAKALPNQIIEVGIAEQNLVGMAAGLAATGKTVFAVSPACFLTSRALDQLKADVCYSNHPVKLVGISAGVSYGALGSTHHSLHDYAALRAIHNLLIVAPADNYETAEAIRQSLQVSTPIYFRFGKKMMPHLPRVEQGFSFGKASLIRRGTDLTFIASGETVHPAYEAAEKLQTEGLNVRVLSMHTLKPLDDAAVLAAANETKALITVEEHSIHGGLGEACAALLMQRGIRIPFKIMGIPDEDTYTGGQMEIFKHYRLDAAGLVAVAREVYGTKQPGF